MTKRLTYLPISALIVLLAGCGGDLPLALSQAVAPASRAASYDPLAPAIETIPLDAALKQAPAIASNGYQLTALATGNQPATDVLAALELADAGGTLTIRAKRPFPAVALYLHYDPQAERVTRLDAGRAGAVSLAFVAEPGLVAIGVAATTDAGLDPATPIATVQFSQGPETAPRRVSAISQVETTAVRDLVAVYEGFGTATLNWHERHTGDYNLDGEVNLSDLTPMGFWYQAAVIPETENWAETEVVDGNEDGLITINDITQIGQNFRSFLTGYNVYRMELATPEDEPTPADEGWVKVENEADPTGPSAPREGMYNGQKTRLEWTFLEEPETGFYAWYVVPTGREGETPYEGPPSNVAKPEGGVVPEVSLTMEIVPPAGELLNVDQEFYLGIKVTDVANLFSANVRFEYDSSLVEFIEAVPFYTDTAEHANLLTDPESADPPEENPLFIGGDVGEAEGGEGYRLVGLNATKKKGDDPRSGTGFVGYAKFRASAAGINDQCFRFPQVTTYIYLWGPLYGVPIATPVPGGPQLVNIAE